MTAIIDKRKEPFSHGYTPLAEEGGLHADMLIDFGIQRLRAGESLVSEEGKERAFLLMSGTASFGWGKNQKTELSRASLLDEGPTVLHVPRGEKVVVEAKTEVELAVQKVANSAAFPAKLYLPKDVRDERFGRGLLQDTSLRIVRTVFDAANAPYSGMVVGEVINFPGRWSSYPPHHHPQPEIYHYRFFPSQGFGYAQVGSEVAIAENYNTLYITPGVPHPQTAAPGYVMYYIWLIPHLEHDKFGPDSRIFEEEHAWTRDPKAKVWTGEEAFKPGT